MRHTVPFLLCIVLFLPHFSAAEERTITSLGRLEPENGVVNLAGPSGGGCAAHLFFGSHHVAEMLEAEGCIIATWLPAMATRGCKNRCQCS